MINPFLGESVSQLSVRQSVISQSVSQSVSHSVIESVSQCVSQSVSVILSILSQKYLSFEFQFPLLCKIDYDPLKVHHSALEED